MQCVNPVLAIRHPKYGIQVIGSVSHFSSDQRRIGSDFELRCGKCVPCLMYKAKQWSIRCMHEASLYYVNSFITLTYDDKHIPVNNSLNKRDMTLFFKRLRKMFPGVKIRYFQCGEYGSEQQRPHHHVLLFGFAFDDMYNWTDTLYRSDKLEQLWNKGHCLIGSVDYKSVAYVCRYSLKKVQSNKYDNKVSEYITMSRNPGIGYNWYKQYNADLYNYDTCVIDSKNRSKPPRYYDKKFSADNYDKMLDIKDKRMLAIISKPIESIGRLYDLKTLAEYRQQQLNDRRQLS